jgi:hypothetical protein
MSNEERILEALAALQQRGAKGWSVTLIEEPHSRKFVQFGHKGEGSLQMDVPCVGLTEGETTRAAQFFRDLGKEGPKEYDAPTQEPGKITHGASFWHNFGDDIRAAARAAMSFFETVYQMPPGVELAITDPFAAPSPETPAAGPAELPEKLRPLAQEIGTYFRELPRLLREGHAGRYAVVKGDSVLWTWDTYRDAMQFGRDKLGTDVLFLVHRVDERDAARLEHYLRRREAVCQA